MEVLKDRDVVCKDCGATFVLPVSEQEFFLKKKISQPKRCKVCRKINREKAEAKKLEKEKQPEESKETA